MTSWTPEDEARERSRLKVADTARRRHKEAQAKRDADAEPRRMDKAQAARTLVEGTCRVTCGRGI